MDMANIKYLSNNSPLNLIFSKKNDTDLCDFAYGLSMCHQNCFLKYISATWYFSIALIILIAVTFMHKDNFMGFNCFQLCTMNKKLDFFCSMYTRSPFCYFLNKTVLKLHVETNDSLWKDFQSEIKITNRNAYFVTKSS